MPELSPLREAALKVIAALDHLHIALLKAKPPEIQKLLDFTKDAVSLLLSAARSVIINA